MSLIGTPLALAFRAPNVEIVWFLFRRGKCVPCLTEPCTVRSARSEIENLVRKRKARQTHRGTWMLNFTVTVNACSFAPFARGKKVGNLFRTHDRCVSLLTHTHTQKNQILLILKNPEGRIKKLKLRTCVSCCTPRPKRRLGNASNVCAHTALSLSTKRVKHDQRRIESVSMASHWIMLAGAHRWMPPCLPTASVSAPERENEPLTVTDSAISFLFTLPLQEWWVCGHSPYIHHRIPIGELTFSQHLSEVAIVRRLRVIMLQRGLAYAVWELILPPTVGSDELTVVSTRGRDLSVSWRRGGWAEYLCKSKYLLLFVLIF